MATPVKEATLDVEKISAVLTRSRPGGAPGETLVVTERGFQPLLGLASSGPSSEPLHLGTPLPMTDQTSGALTRAPLFAIAEGPGAAQPGVCLLATKDALLSFEPSGVLKLLAGQPGNPGYADGVAGAAQIASAAVMTAGAHGDVWFSDGSRKHVRRASRQASGGAGGAAAPTASSWGAVVVSTMRWEVPDYTLVHSLAYDTAGDVLYVLTPRSVYRAAAPADPSSRLELVAGSEEASGCVDGGYGRAALFGSICDAAVDGAGRLLVLDMEGPGGGAVVRVVDPRAGYAVSSVQPALGDLSGHAGRLDLLPSGELCVYEWGGNKLRLLQLPAPPPPPPAPAAAPAPAPSAAGDARRPSSAEAASMKVLSEDWGAMLVTDPWNLYDVSIAVNGPRGARSFGAHSLILLARCEYLRFQINQQKAQGVTGKFSIPIDDADAEAFWLLLRHIYTGRVDFPPLMVEPVLQLAERMRMQRSADIIRTLLHPSSSTADGSQQVQVAAAATAATAAAAAGATAGAAAYGAASAPSAPPAAGLDGTSAPSAPSNAYGAAPAAPAAQSSPPMALPAAASAASAPGAQQPPPSADLPYPLAPFQTPVAPPQSQQQPQQAQQQAASGYGQGAAASTPSPYGGEYGAYAAPAAAPAAAQQSPYGYSATTSAPPYGGPSASPYAAAAAGAPSPYGPPPAAAASQSPYGPPSAQTPYGAPPAASAQTPYGAPPAASGQTPYGQTPYGAPPAAGAQTPYGQTPYGAPPATSAQTPYGQTPYGAPLGASPYAYGAPPQQQQQQPAGYSPYGGGYYPGQQR